MFTMKDVPEHTSSITLRRNLNTCRLFLNVTYISEIIFIDCDNIIQGVMQGNPNKIPPSTLNWPK